VTRPVPSWTAAQLRRDLNLRAEHLARTQNLLHDLSTGTAPSVLFGADEHSRHGNFHPESYARICATPEWLRRLAKPHTASRRSRARHDWRWMELDSAASSDALLMNIFCHPGVFDGARLAAPIAALLNVDSAAQPCFGTRPGVPLRTVLKPRNKRSDVREALDRTEIDLTLADSSATLFLEAKLTESDFQTAAPALLTRYRDLETVFDVTRLPKPLNRIPRTLLIPPPLRGPHPARVPHPSSAWVGSNYSARVPHSSQSYRDEWDPQTPHIPDPDFPDDSFLNLPTRPAKPRITGYQLIRNVLAAHAADAGFCVLCDARRHDLIEIWYSILAAVHTHALTPRLKLLTWQELAAALPADLQHFLDTKYGIAP
jgi:hypothetical protein